MTIDDTADDTAPRRRSREATTAALLEAAKFTFAERGFDAATTREIAARAGVNEQLIQRYFNGKNGLLLAVVEHYNHAEGQGCALPPLGESLEQDLAAILAQQIAHSWACRDFTRVMLNRALVDPAIAAEMGRTLSDTRIPCILKRLESFRERGDITADADLPAMAAGLASLSFSLGFLEQVVFDEDPGRLRRVADTLAHTLAAGLAPRDRATNSG